MYINVLALAGGATVTLAGAWSLYSTRNDHERIDLVAAEIEKGRAVVREGLRDTPVELHSALTKQIADERGGNRLIDSEEYPVDALHRAVTAHRVMATVSIIAGVAVMASSFFGDGARDE